MLWAISLDHSAYPSVSSSEPWPANTPIRLCAIRVEFQADTVTGTTGTGLMGSGLPDTLIIDPLPHNRAYFRDHLQFMSNYYGTVSKGAISFSHLDVYPQADDEIYQLEFPMWHYNYNTDDDLLDQRLVELFAQTVTLASADIDFSEYDAVLIFHAGVGKDFNIGYDQTPFDIPSAFISEDDLQSYSGSLPTGVTKGLILPESQNQQEVLEYGIELSLNGVLVKLFGNWLGMPDLFNTEDGSSGIGRWGMMDQGSGNVNALVPSLPDIWSRIYMGWETPTTIVPPGINDTIRVARFEVPGAPEAIKIPITPSEYYLIENRDANADSAQWVRLYDRDHRKMTVDPEGNIGIEAGFKVAINAEHYDFGIPGSGILIWHIDENVINENLDDNRVNADPSHRGVDLVEADGSQDIGEEFAFATAGSGTELGIQEDCWYRTNRNHRDANGGVSTVRFNDRSRPATKLYDKSVTNLEFANFSDVDSIMSFTIRSTNTIEGFPVSVGTTAQADSFYRLTGVHLKEFIATDLDGDGINEFCIHTGDTLKILDSTATVIWFTPMYWETTFADPGYQIDLDNDGKTELLLEGSRVGIIEYENGEYQLRQANILLPIVSRPTVRPAVGSDGQPRLLVYEFGGGYYLDPVILNLDLNILSEGEQDPTGAQYYKAQYNLSAYPSNSFAFFKEGRIANSISQVCLASVQDTSLEVVSTVDVGDGFPSFPVAVINEPSGTSIHITGFGVLNASNGEIIFEDNEYVIPDVDWDGDGVADGAYYAGSSTVQRENAPQLDVDVQQIIDLDASGDPDIIGLSDEINQRRFTRVKAAEHSGPIFPGFPIATPGTPNSKFFEWGSGNLLHYVSITEVNSVNYLSVQRLPISTANRERFAYTESDAIINVGPLRPQIHNRDDFVYCWPNPTSDISHIRFTASTAATAIIQVFDLVGRRVATLSGSSDAAGQFEVDWDVAGIQSGVYIARAELVVGGQTHNSELKIAVVK